jgi:hypothetical protein
VTNGLERSPSFMPVGIISIARNLDVRSAALHG